MAGEIVHLEMPSSDFARSAAFYQKLFGWTTEGVQSGGHLRFDLPGGVQGSWIRNALAQAPGPVPFVAVDDVDKALDDAEKNGGRVLVRRLMLGDRGRFGLLADFDGNVIGVLAAKGVSGARPEAKSADAGAKGVTAPAEKPAAKAGATKASGGKASGKGAPGGKSGSTSKTGGRKR